MSALAEASVPSASAMDTSADSAAAAMPKKESAAAAPAQVPDLAAAIAAAKAKDQSDETFSPELLKIYYKHLFPCVPALGPRLPRPAARLRRLPVRIKTHRHVLTSPTPPSLPAPGTSPCASGCRTASPDTA